MNKQWWSLLHLGWSLTLVTTLFIGGGHLLDIRYGTAPLWTLVGGVVAFLSLGVMIWNIVRQLDKGEK